MGWGQYQPPTTGAVMTASLRSNVFSILYSKTFDWGEWPLQWRKV